MDAKSYKLSDIENHKFHHLLQKSYITIVGIGDFGEAILYRLIRYQRAAEDLPCSNWVHVSYDAYHQRLNWAGFSDGLVSETELVLLVGDCNDSTYHEARTELTTKFQGTCIVDFCSNADEHRVVPGADAVVHIKEDVHEGFLAVRLLPDILMRNNMVGLDFNDVYQILRFAREFQLLEFNFRKEEIRGEKELHRDIPSIGAGIFAVYGDEELEMRWVDTLTRFVDEKTKEEANVVSNTVIDAAKNDKVKLVILYSENYVTTLW